MSNTQFDENGYYPECEHMTLREFCEYMTQLAEDMN